MNTTKAAATAETAVPGAAFDPRLLIREEGLKGYLTEFKRKVKGGELGSLPVVIGLIVIWGIFQGENSSFLTAGNLSSILYYVAGTGLISVGLVFVLLLGEIDLSVASVSGLCSAVFGVLAVNHGMNAWLATILALLTGAAIGALHGWFFAKIGVPAFVVTLAGNLAWNGLMIKVLGQSGSINLSAKGLFSFLGIGNSAFFMGADIAGGYLLAVLATAAMLISSLLERRRRVQAGVPARPFSEILLRTGLLAVAVFLTAWVLNQSTGVPNSLVLFGVVLIVCDFVLRRTPFGRKIFAVGGNIEASRRAGISVPAIRISVFAISGFFAALGGLVLAAEQGAASTSAGSGNALMLAIAAPVIGGTSLFGGRGRIWSALLGMLVIESITMGLNLLNMQSSVQFMITGGVLLAAVVIDSVSRRTQKASGRA
nr:sugar ABC transporter permease [Mangrovactinospora gilvigrisea]